MIGFPSFHLPSQPPYIRDDPFSRVLLNLLGHRGGACAGHEREHDECGEDGVSEDGHEDDDQHDVQDQADKVSQHGLVLSEKMHSHADQQDYERESGQQEKPVSGFSGGGEGPFDQRSVHDIVLGMQPVLVECQRDDVGQGCKYGGFLFYGDLSDHVPDSSERSVPPRRRSRPR